jgi:ankyrin repeat protein
MGFTRIHKLILGLEQGDVEAEIGGADIESINAPDFGGRTPLSWAAQRGDLNLVNMLLAHGGDPNITTPNKMSPLHYAVEALNPSCIKPLLDHGADVHATDHPLGLHNSLHFACDHHNNIEYLVPLIEAGIDVNARTFYWYTPIVAAVCSDHWACVEYLLDHGADINGRAQYGRTPIMYAIECNAHECLRIFLRRGADHTMKCENGHTIAHIAARYADLETMQILNEANLQPLSLNSLEMEGLESLLIPETITKRLQEGDCSGEAFTTAFDMFIKKIVDPADLENLQDSEEGINEEWEDALEEQFEQLTT